MKHNERKIHCSLAEKYDDNFAYIEKVINSCVNKTQLDIAVSWGLAYLERVSKYEYEEHGSFEYWVVKNYFDSKKNMIMFKIRESLKSLH